MLTGQLGTGADLLGRPLADADVVRLARVDDVGECAHRLLERGGHVEPVGLVEVDVVGLESLQRAVDGLHDVLAAQAGVVVALGPGRPVDLGQDLQALPALTLEGLAEDGLCRRVGVHVRGVERRDACVEGRVDARRGGVVLDLRAVGEPVAVDDLADDETASSQVSVVHPSITHRARG